jgi:hypothetical protein
LAKIMQHLQPLLLFTSSPVYSRSCWASCSLSRNWIEALIALFPIYLTKMAKNFSGMVFYLLVGFFIPALITTKPDLPTPTPSKFVHTEHVQLEEICAVHFQRRIKFMWLWQSV